ncbi:MAG TPA: hypothetical protein VGP94_00460 [Tepidisphaeraceae bacterium]|nr:hypothetical protein [Tepidisphaeraceae bacterium]
MVSHALAEDPDDPLDQQIARAIYAADQVAPQSTGTFHLTLEGMWMYGPVSGHLQTPSGGRPGTSSRDRPTLGEIGINTASIFDAEMTAAMRDHGLYIGGQWVRLSGERNLEQSLVSQGDSFLLGSRVKSDVQLDWYRIGYRYRIQRGDEAGAELPNTEIYSRLGAAILDFHYRLDGAGAAQADRAYIKAAPQMGVEMEWHATRNFSLAGELTSTLPFPSMPWIVTAQLQGKFRFIEKGNLSLGGFVGAGYEKISFHDHQDLSNDINADFGPMLMVGLELRF